MLTNYRYFRSGVSEVSHIKAKGFRKKLYEFMCKVLFGEAQFLQN